MSGSPLFVYVCVCVYAYSYTVDRRKCEYKKLKRQIDNGYLIFKERDETRASVHSSCIANKLNKNTNPNIKQNKTKKNIPKPRLFYFWSVLAVGLEYQDICSFCRFKNKTI
jgi:hypothetical protein